MKSLGRAGRTNAEAKRTTTTRGFCIENYSNRVSIYVSVGGPRRSFGDVRALEMKILRSRGGYEIVSGRARFIAYI